MSGKRGVRRLAVSDQVRKLMARSTLRWLFQCFEGIDWFEGIDLHHTRHLERAPPSG